jgi:hypothetical protein
MSDGNFRDFMVTWRCVRDGSLGLSLRRLESCSPIPWLCCGDFNEILDASEKKGGARRPGTQMKEFQNALEHCLYCDMGFNGSGILGLTSAMMIILPRKDWIEW